LGIVSSLPPSASYSTSPKGAPPQTNTKGIWSVLAGVGLLVLAKLKGLVILLKALPVGKLLITTGSMLAMVLLEATRGGAKFAIGFVALILIHELGHGYAMKQHGIAAGWPIFIPFFGAMISMKQTPTDRNVEAAIAFGGPYAGTGASLAVAALGMYEHSRWLYSLAYTGFFLNLFNMTPLSPLDGGRIAQAFSKRAWVIGLIVLGGLLLWTGTPQLILIALMALPQLLRKGADGREPLSEMQRMGWAVKYFGLCAFLTCGMYFSGALMRG
jgi:Zn-dependent protease